MKAKQLRKYRTISTASFTSSQASPNLLVFENEEIIFYSRSARQSYEYCETFCRSASGSFDIGGAALGLLDRESFDVVLGETLLDNVPGRRYHAPGYCSISANSERLEVDINDVLAARSIVIRVANSFLRPVYEMSQVVDRRFRLFFRTPSSAYRYAVYLDSSHLSDLIHGEAKQATIDEIQIVLSAWLPSFSQSKIISNKLGEIADVAPAKVLGSRSDGAPPQILDSCSTEVSGDDEVIFTDSPRSADLPLEDKRSSPATFFNIKPADNSSEKTLYEASGTSKVQDEAERQEKTADNEQSTACRPHFRPLRALRGPVQYVSPDIPKRFETADVDPSDPELPQKSTGSDENTIDQVNVAGNECLNSTVSDAVSSSVNTENTESSADEATTPTSFGIKRPKLRSFSDSPSPMKALYMGTKGFGLAASQPFDAKLALSHSIDIDTAASAMDNPPKSSTDEVVTLERLDAPNTQDCTQLNVGNNRNGAENALALPNFRRSLTSAQLDGFESEGVASDVNSSDMNDDTNTAFSHGVAEVKGLSVQPASELEQALEGDIAHTEEVFGGPEEADFGIGLTSDAINVNEAMIVDDASLPKSSPHLEDISAEREDWAPELFDEKQGLAVEAVTTNVLQSDAADEESLGFYGGGIFAEILEAMRNETLQVLGPPLAISEDAITFRERLSHNLTSETRATVSDAEHDAAPEPSYNALAADTFLENVPQAYVEYRALPMDAELPVALPIHTLEFQPARTSIVTISSIMSSSGESDTIPNELTLHGTQLAPERPASTSSEWASYATRPPLAQTASTFSYYNDPSAKLLTSIPVPEVLIREPKLESKSEADILMPPVEELQMPYPDVTHPELIAPPKHMILIVPVENSPEVEFLGTSLAIGLNREHAAPIFDLTAQRSSSRNGILRSAPITDALPIDAFQNLFALDGTDTSKPASGQTEQPPGSTPATETDASEVAYVVGYLRSDLLYPDWLDRVENMIASYEGECDVVLLAREVSSLITASSAIKRITQYSSNVFFLGENTSWPRYIERDEKLNYVPVEIGLPSASVLLPAMLAEQEHGVTTDAKPLQTILTAWSHYILRMMKIDMVKK